MLCAEVAPETCKQRVFAGTKKSVVSGVFQPESTTGTGQKNRERIRTMTALIRRFWIEDDGQDIAEYAVMLAVILVLVVGNSTGWL